MITSVRMVNFKNFADETLKVGPFTVIVGANASGKSNIRDAFRFLHGIGRGYTRGRDSWGGNTGRGGHREWEADKGGDRMRLTRFWTQSSTFQRSHGFSLSRLTATNKVREKRSLSTL